MKVRMTAITHPVVEEDLDMGVEEYIIWCARTSSPGNRLNYDTAPGLLKYLIDHKHWSPFEMVSFAFEITTSRAIAQQILRHRSFSFQEFSQRYARVDAMESFEMRMQAMTNRQSSTSEFTDMALVQEAFNLVNSAQELYGRLVDAGAAKETARFILPLCTQTTLVMHGTLRSWIHFLDQRCDSHAQKEIRNIAVEIRSRLSLSTPWLANALQWPSQK